MTQPAVARATRYNEETLPQGMAETTAEPAGIGRITKQQGRASAGKQRLVCLLAGQDTQRTSKNKARTPQHRAFEKKRVFLKMSSVAAESNIAT